MPICGKSRATGVLTGEFLGTVVTVFVFLLSCHEVQAPRPSTACLCPSRGPRPPPHYVLVVTFTAVEILCVHVCYRHFEEITSEVTGEVREKTRRRRCKAGPHHRRAAPLLVYLLSHTHRMAVRRRASPLLLLLLRSRSLLQTWSVIVFITFFFLELRRDRND